MFVTIFGLPPTIKYQELKSLIKQQCNLIDIIVDNIIPTPDGSKKVRIGLADDGEAMKLIKGLDGFRMQGNQVIKVVPVNKTTSNTQQGFSAQQYPQATDFRNQGSYGGPNRTMDSMNRPQPWGPEVQSAWSLNPSMGQAQNSFGYAQTGYGQQQQFQPQRPDAPFPQGRPPMDQYRGKPNVPDNRRPVEPRSHTLRSIEIIDSPAMAPPGQQSRYPPGPVKDVIPGPRWEVPANQGPSQYQGQSHKEPSHWAHQDSGHFNDERRGLLDKRDPKMTPQMRIQDIKNYDKDPFPQQKPSPGRPEMGGRMTQGRPVSPRYAGRPVSPSRPGTHGRKSPIRLGMDGRQLPARPGMDGRQSPGRPGMHGRQSPSRSGMDGRQSPGRLGMHSRTSPGRQGGRPMSPRHGRMMSPDRGRMGRPVSPRTGRMDPGIQGRHSPGRMPSGRTRSPKNYPEHGRPLDGRPGMGGAHISPERQHGRPMSPVRQMPGRSDSPRRQPGGRPMPPGKGSSPSRIILRPGSPGMRPGRPGSPSKPGTFSGRPISPGPRGMMDQRPGGRHGSPGARGARPGSPGKVGPFGRPVSPGRLNQRHGMGRPGSPGRFGGGISGSPRRPEHGRPSSPVRRQPSPHGRMPGPRGRSGSPVRRGSPAPRRMGDRVESPRRISPHRYSPGRHHPDKHGPYDHDPSKPARPAYDMFSH